LGITIGNTVSAMESRGGEVRGATTSTTTVIATSTPKKTLLRFKNYLRPGIRGAEVVELQKRLFGMGQYTGPITGYFGNLTFTAVKKFQKTHSIDQVGYVGPKTRAQLNKIDQEGPESWVVMSTGQELSILRI
jgi:peptidoglycan hydrolase-like protein with peptidoglycan-binding domain